VRTPPRTRVFHRNSPGIALALIAPHRGGQYMLWVLAVLMGGLGFGYVTIRRKRKAQAK
jgi:hypothetical protein